MEKGLFLPRETMKIIFKILVIFIFFLTNANLFAEELSLKESLEIALQNSSEIHQAKEKIAEAKARKRESFTSFLPAIGSSSTFTQLGEESTLSVSGFPSVTMTDQELYDLNLNLKQPLFTGGKLTALYRQTKEAAKIAEENYRRVEINLIFKVKKAYYNILKAEKIQAVSKEAVEQIKAHLKVVENFYQAGMAPKVDLLKAKVQLANIKQNLVEAENGLELAKASFNNLLNRDLSAPVELVDVLSYTPTSSLTSYPLPSWERKGRRGGGLNECVEKALKLRPELKMQKIALKMAEEGLRIAKSDYLPAISLIANYDQKKGSEIPIDQWQKSWNAVVAFELDIWNWGRTKAKVRQAKSVINQNQDALSLLKKTIELEVRNAFLNLQATEKKIFVTRKAVEQSKEGFRMTDLRFKEGMATNTDVLDATTLQSQAETNYYQALYDCHIAEAGLKRAMGER